MRRHADDVDIIRASSHVIIRARSYGRIFVVSVTGRTLRAVRKQRGLTQDALAIAANISQSRISLAERRRVRLRADELERLTRVLAITAR